MPEAQKSVFRGGAVYPPLGKEFSSPCPVWTPLGKEFSKLGGPSLPARKLFSLEWNLGFPWGQKRSALRAATFTRRQLPPLPIGDRSFEPIWQQRAVEGFQVLDGGAWNRLLGSAHHGEHDLGAEFLQQGHGLRRKSSCRPLKRSVISASQCFTPAACSFPLPHTLPRCLGKASAATRQLIGLTRHDALSICPYVF